MLIPNTGKVHRREKSANHETHVPCVPIGCWILWVFRIHFGIRWQARIQGVGAGARAHPRGGVSPFKMQYSIAFKHQSITGRPPLGEILYPPLDGDDLFTNKPHCKSNKARKTRMILRIDF